MTIAVVILNYNGAELLPKFLPDVLRFSPEAEVVVIDNKSTDKSLDYLETLGNQISLIKLSENFGFAGGYNIGLGFVKKDIYILLNSDVEVSEGWLLPIIETFNTDNKIVACQPKVLAYSDKSKFEYAGAAGGYIDALGYPYCRGRVLDIIEVDNGQYDNSVDIFWATGAALAIRSEWFWKVGAFDDRFFAHMEEIDLCWRINARGGKIVSAPKSVVYHMGGGTLNSESPYKTYLNFRNNQLLLYKNLDSKRYLSVVVLRFFLDILAAIHLVARGKFQNGYSVLRAWKDFFKMKKKYKENREENIRLTVEDVTKLIKTKSILAKRYLR